MESSNTCKFITSGALISTLNQAHYGDDFDLLERRSAFLDLCKVGRMSIFPLRVHISSHNHVTNTAQLNLAVLLN